MKLEDYLYELSDEDYKRLIEKRIPTNDCEIIIVAIPKMDKTHNYIDVAFYFRGLLDSPEVLYTHFYFKEIDDYFKQTRICFKGTI